MVRGVNLQCPPQVVGEPLITCATNRRSSLAVESRYSVSRGSWAPRKSPTTYWTAEAPSFSALGTAVEAAIAVKSASPKLPTVDEILLQSTSLCGEHSLAATSKELHNIARHDQAEGSEQSTSIRDEDDYRSHDASLRLATLPSGRTASVDVDSQQSLRKTHAETFSVRREGNIEDGRHDPLDQYHYLESMKQTSAGQISYASSLSSLEGASDVSASNLTYDIRSYESWKFMAHRELLLSSLPYQAASTHKINVWFVGDETRVEPLTSVISDVPSHSSVLAQSSSWASAALPVSTSVGTSSYTTSSRLDWIGYAAETSSLGHPLRSHSQHAKSLSPTIDPKSLRLPRCLSFFCGFVHLSLCPIPFIRGPSRVGYFLIAVHIMMCLIFLSGYPMSKIQTESFKTINHRIVRHLVSGAAVCLGSGCGCLLIIGIHARYQPKGAPDIQCVETPLGCLEMVETYLPLSYSVIFMLWTVLALFLQQRLKNNRIPLSFSIFRLLLAALMFAASVSITISCAFASAGTIIVGCVTIVVTVAPVTSSWCCSHLAIRPLIIQSALLGLIVISILLDIFSSHLTETRMYATFVIPLALFTMALIAIAQGRYLHEPECLLTRFAATKLMNRLASKKSGSVMGT